MLSFHHNLSKNKSFELQLNLFDDMSADYIFTFNFHWSIHSDHAGPRLMIILWHILYFEISVYDHRHWDYDYNNWRNIP